MEKQNVNISSDSEYYRWVTSYMIQYAMLPYIKNREFAILQPSWKTNMQNRSMRYWRIHNIQSFQFMIKNINYFNSCPNMYYSVATYKDGIPKTDKKYNSSSVELEHFKENSWQYMSKYDFIIDIDDHTEIDEFDASKLQTQKIHEFLKIKNIKHQVRFSGNGFHIVVKYEDYPFSKEFSFNPQSDNSIYREYAKFARYLKEKYSMIDIGIYDHRRVIKCPYTLIFNSEGIYISLPLTEEELYLCKKKDFIIENYFYLSKSRDDIEHRERLIIR